MTSQPYGLRTNPDGFSFLLQPSGEQNLIVKGLSSGLEPKGFAPRYCLHNIDLDEWVEPPEWVSDPFIQAFLPTPGVGAFLVRNEDRRYDTLLRQMTRLNGSDVAMLRPLWNTQTTLTRSIYEGTNLGPVLWITTNLDQAQACPYHVELAHMYQRRVIFIACGPFPPFIHLSPLTTELRDLGAEPLEKIGSGVLRKIMHG